MIARALVLVLLSTAPAMAAERKLYVSSFDRVRVQGPYEVRIATGSPGGTVTGDRDVIDALEVRVEGSSLVVRGGISKWEDTPRTRSGAPVVVTLTTPTLASGSVAGGGRLTIAQMKAPRVDLSVTGTGAIAVTTVEADAANATLVGDGAITLAGRAGKARLMTNGGGTIDAGGLEAGDLIVRVDGLGTTRARARYTAQVANTGLGRIDVAGSPKCIVKSDAGGPVTCGTGQ